MTPVTVDVADATTREQPSSRWIRCLLLDECNVWRREIRFSADNSGVGRRREGSYAAKSIAVLGESRSPEVSRRRESARRPGARLCSSVEARTTLCSRMSGYCQNEHHDAALIACNTRVMSPAMTNDLRTMDLSKFRESEARARAVPTVGYKYRKRASRSPRARPPAKLCDVTRWGRV